MPPLGAILGGVDFQQLHLTISSQTFATLAEAEAAGVPVIKYGLFIQSVVDFALIAFAIFMVVKVINRLQRQQADTPAEPAPTPEEVLLLREIRDALKK